MRCGLKSICWRNASDQRFFLQQQQLHTKTAHVRSLFAIKKKLSKICHGKEIIFLFCGICYAWWISSAFQRSNEPRWKLNTNLLKLARFPSVALYYLLLLQMYDCTISTVAVLCTYWVECRTTTNLNVYNNFNCFYISHNVQLKCSAPRLNFFYFIWENGVNCNWTITAVGRHFSVN